MHYKRSINVESSTFSEYKTRFILGKLFLDSSIIDCVNKSMMFLEFEFWPSAKIKRNNPVGRLNTGAVGNLACICRVVALSCAGGCEKYCCVTNAVVFCRNKSAEVDLSYLLPFCNVIKCKSRHYSINWFTVISQREISVLVRLCYT